MNKVYVGLPQSGKTTRLIDEYRKLVEGGARTDHILVLVMSLPQGRKWRKALDLPVTGPIQVLTFWGFVQRELLRFWRLALPRLGDGEAVIQPVFLNAESAHYLMTVLVDEARDAGRFADMVATSSRIALQILNNLNQAAIHGLDHGICHRQAARRLQRRHQEDVRHPGCPGGGELLPAAVPADPVPGLLPVGGCLLPVSPHGTRVPVGPPGHIPLPDRRQPGGGGPRPARPDRRPCLALPTAPAWPSIRRAAIPGGSAPTRSRPRTGSSHCARWSGSTPCTAAANRQQASPRRCTTTSGPARAGRRLPALPPASSMTGRSAPIFAPR